MNLNINSRIHSQSPAGEYNHVRPIEAEHRYSPRSLHY